MPSFLVYPSSSFTFSPLSLLQENNFYGEDICRVLGGVSGAREVHILMDKINSPIQDGVLLPIGYHIPIETPVISELGVFGVFLK